MTSPSTSTLEISEAVKAFDIPLANLQAQHPNKRLVVGVAIVSSHTCEPGEKKVLLVRRVATESEFAGLYELPGGGSEVDLDRTILNTVVRETVEETGLTVTRVLGSFDGFEYETSKGKSIQFNFLVEVEGGKEAEVKLNPEEHDEFVWLGAKDALSLSEYGLTGSMEVVVEHALKLIA